MNAYRVPAVSVTGDGKVNVFRPPAAASLKPASVDVARSAPVGTGVVPVVFRIDSVMFGFAPLQPEQKSSTSTRLSWPETVGVKVWPAQLVLLKPNPVGLTLEFFVSVLSGFERTTEPGTDVRSQFAGTPRWNDA